MRQFPVVGGQLGEPMRLGGDTIGLIVGILASLYGGLGVAPSRSVHDEHRVASAA